MKVLILGGSGHIGKRMLETLANTSWCIPTGASRGTVNSRLTGTEWIRLDTCDAVQLTAALRGFDAVVNCVAGDALSISNGTQMLVQAALSAGCPRIIHLSTMSVYGRREGMVSEDAPLDPGVGWYGRAKCEAEQHIRQFVRHGGEVVMLRPGCVFGPGSELWVGRIGRWLRAGRLGDLGASGDGWSNLVHVDDVCQALVAALQFQIQPGDVPIFNLAAPDSPRWNEYFVDLALALKATPVRRIRRRQLQLDAQLAGPPLKLAQMALKRAKWFQLTMPDPMPPGLLNLWAQHIHLNTQLASQKLKMVWTPYALGLQTSANWMDKNEISTSALISTACTH
jgi:nucleoside-diphosphate-sugar epimerase